MLIKEIYLKVCSNGMIINTVKQIVDWLDQIEYMIVLWNQF